MNRQAFLLLALLATILALPTQAQKRKKQKAMEQPTHVGVVVPDRNAPKIEAPVVVFVQDPLPYAFNALEPYIDARTMEIHYGKHHKAYTDNLNAAIKDTPMAQMRIEQLLAQPELSAAVRNNGGGFYNHNLFWAMMSPNGGQPSAALQQAIDQTFGSMDKFKEDFNKAAMTRFGSGWAWLVVNADGKLQICSTANQDNPLMQGVGCSGTPILALDVWEHAYYLNYQNRRADYTKAFWSVVNWQDVSRRYAEATAK